MPDARTALLIAIFMLPGCIPRADPPASQRPELVTSARAPAPSPRPAFDDRQAPPPSGYTVVNGDTLDLIAERTGVDAAVIAKANGLQPPYVIRSGERLVIPRRRYPQ